MAPLKSYSMPTWDVVTGIDCEFKGKKKFFLISFYFKLSSLWLSR